MRELEERILAEGKILPGNIIRVDSFLNHQMDPVFIHKLGMEFAQRFKDKGVTKILTIEASGIAVAIMTGLCLNVPVVFAKKQKAKNMGKDVYTSSVESYTKGQLYDIAVSKDYIKSSDKILIIDDFLAMGQAVMGLVDITSKSGASLVGVGIVIEKGFQQGGKLIREKGIHLESLAIINEISETKIVFKI